MSVGELHLTVFYNDVRVPAKSYEILRAGDVTLSEDVRVLLYGDDVMHKANCTVDLSNTVGNVSGTYVYCSCGIHLKVTWSADPLKRYVDQEIAQLREDPKIDRVLQLRQTLKDEVGRIESLITVLDATAKKYVKELVSEGGLDAQV